ncbi:hypothetical protein SPI_09235 [Niveomyces insectorum RCEF 264]|uniref:Uncharacterized protein n=1 Tax=Niveomyces insectorum RCEF 264 TaxID=1081102 RepID=A0A162MBG4_9HYPO|nr:hypothetical protein SPI_09235 [Niveomyces insectorum RCEF 264]
MREAAGKPGGPPGDVVRMTTLIGGCFQEAMSADLVAGCLENLRGFLAEPLHPHLNALIDEIRKCSRVLRQIVEETRTHHSRTPVLLDYLDMLLPCFRRSLADIKGYYENKSMTKELRWRTMYHKMTEEASGLHLPQRFALYHQFLVLLEQMLTRSPNFDMNALEVLQKRILQLREKRGIAPPSQPGALVTQTMIMTAADRDRNIHWAEDIFSRPLPSRTPLKNLKLSKSFGPWGDVLFPPDARIFYRRWFDQDRLSVIVFMNPRNNAPYMVIRSLEMGSNNPLYSIRGIHELCISRDDSCLVLKRWSHTERCSKLWAVLYFLTWEEMVLFHCAFVALKYEDELTYLVHPKELRLSREKRLFQARIIDDDFKHSLIVYKDVDSQKYRLHAAVWEGEMRQCPVWTAFITNQPRSPNWLIRKDKLRVWLTDVQLYVFCNDYRQEHMRQNKMGAFELDFLTEEAAQRFTEVFETPPPTPSVSSNPPTDSSLTSSRASESTDLSNPDEKTPPLLDN